MSDFANSIQSPERLRAQALSALEPFFLEAAKNDPTAARATAQGLLDDYKARTPKELQLATQVVALGLASIACLRTATAAKNLPIGAILDLQDSALSLNALWVKAMRALQARQKERAKNPAALTAEKKRWDEGAFQLSVNQALDKFNEANARMAAYTASLEPEPKKTRLSIMFAERMTPSVLARRARLN